MPARRMLLRLLAMPAFVRPARAQALWPARAVRLVVPYPPGGTSDILARPFAEFLRQRLGSAVVLDNRPGASTNIGNETVARAAPDGYTLLLGQASMIGNVFTGPRPNYDPRHAFAPVGLVARVPYMLAANPSFDARDVGAFIRLARAAPGRHRIASAQLDFQVAQMARRAGIEIEHVAYRGGAQATSDCIAGQVEMVFALVPVLLPFVRDGALRAIGVTTAARSPVLAETQSFREAGVAALDSGTWYGLFAPAGTSDAIVRRLAADVAAFAADPAAASRLGSQGYGLESSSPEQLGQVFARTAEEYAAIVRELDWRPAR